MDDYGFIWTYFHDLLNLVWIMLCWSTRLDNFVSIFPQTVGHGSYWIYTCLQGCSEHSLSIHSAPAKPVPKLVAQMLDDVRCQDSAKSCIKLDRGMPSSTGSCCCRHRFCRSSSFRFSRITTSLTWARSCSLRSLKSGAKPLFLCSLFGARGWQDLWQELSDAAIKAMRSLKSQSQKHHLHHLFKRSRHL